MVVGVVFDIDGTLVTFRFDVRGTRQALIEELGRRGYDTTGLGPSSPTQEILDSAREQSEAGRGQSYGELRAAVFAILDRFELEGAETTALLPGVRPALDALRSRGARLGVLSNSGRKAAHAALGRAGLLDCFEFVLTRDDTETMKPRPEGLEMAAAMFGLPKSSVYYVGDSAFDVLAARAAGIKVISVATGNYTAESLRAERADYTISSLSELAALLGV
jgi:phosphoglycolate phosphatase